MIKVVIEAGHSEAPKDFSREDEINLLVSQAIQAKIFDETKAGNNKDIVSVIIPKILRGRKLDLMDKVYFANDLKADLLLSVHCNWSSNKEANGFNIYYDDKKTELAARSRRFAEILDGKMKGYNFTSWGTAVDIDTHTAPGNLAICSYSRMPAVLIELGFLSNERDAVELEKADTQALIARAHYEAIKNYFL